MITSNIIKLYMTKACISLIESLVDRSMVRLKSKSKTKSIINQHSYWPNLKNTFVKDKISSQVIF